MATGDLESGPIAERVSERIDQLRRDRRLTLGELSARLRFLGRPMSVSTLSKIVNGDRRVDVDDLVALAVALDVPPNAMILPAEANPGTDLSLTPSFSLDFEAAWSWARTGGSIAGAIGPDAPWQAHLADSSKPDVSEKRTIQARVFLSYTSDLRRFPAGVSFADAAYVAVKRLGFVPVDMAYFTASATTPAELCRARLQESDVYVGIVGFRYGSMVRGESDQSYTEMEFSIATDLGLPRLVFLLDKNTTGGPRQYLVDDETGHLQDAFRRRLEDAAVTVSTVATPEQLEAALLQAFGRLELGKEEPRGQVDSPLVWLPDLADLVVNRPLLDDQLAHELHRSGPRAVTTVHGGAGFGKTTAALCACRREDVRDAFPDGVLWVDVGQDVGETRLAERINALALRLGDRRPGPTDPLQAGMRLGELLGDRRMLLVIDDVWRDDQLTPFLQGGPNCHRLVTTRNRRVVPASARMVVVERMEREEGEALLTGLVPQLDPTAATALTDTCGRWPLLLRLVAGYLRTRVGSGVGVDDALVEVQRGLSEMGAFAFDDLFHRGRPVAKAVETSLALLESSSGQPVTGDSVNRYQELAIFPEGEVVPVQVLGRLWERTAGWGSWAVTKFCALLADMALVEIVPNPQGIRLHDVVQQYLRDRVGSDMVAVHDALLATYRRELPAHEGRTAWWELPLGEDYLWRHLERHLVGAGAQAEYAALLRDRRWVAAKTHAVGLAGPEVHTELLHEGP